ncbi:MAG: hypothetical protein VKJ46_00740 [Leptolyngbyaceae bacterium]|nr:hypothetical protein [Leptolyngbyaceae bacterium]
MAAVLLGQGVGWLGSWQQRLADRFPSILLLIAGISLGGAGLAISRVFIQSSSGTDFKFQKQSPF